MHSSHEPHGDSAQISTAEVATSAETPGRKPQETLPGAKTNGFFLALLIAATVAVFLLITLGGVVRTTESGLGCPDWPLCHGKVIPPLEFHTLMEYSHRLAGSLTSTLIVLAAAIAWWRYRKTRQILGPVTAALALLGVEVVLGGITVLKELPPTIVTVHLATAELIFALMLVTAIRLWQARRHQPATSAPQVYRWAEAAAWIAFLVMISGSYIVGRGAGTSCPNWPLCGDGLVPSYWAGWLHMSHRIAAGVGGLVAGWAALVAWRSRGTSKYIGWATAIAGGAVIAQTLVGAANPWTGFSAAAKTAHLALATALWGSFVALVPLPRPAASSTSARSGLWALATDYIALTKPRIILLLLVTALGGMFLAARGVPPISTAVLVLLGGALGAGGANSLNHYFDMDIDEQMRRTQQRPLPSRRVPPGNALSFGVALNILAFIILALGVNLLSALLTMGASAFYVWIYTRWLKRSTTQNIVIGGAAGAMPPLIGWAAITGRVDLPALYLFAMVFFWTPPHFWALALLLRNDYARARVPMLPVVAGVQETARSILLHTIILVAITLLFFTVGNVGWLYLGGAAALGGYFLFLAWRLFRSQTMRLARGLYLYSLLYLAVLFALIMAEALIRR